MRSLLISLVTIFVFSNVSAILSTCPEENAINNFNTSMFLGTWKYFKWSDGVTLNCAQFLLTNEENGDFLMTTSFYNQKDAVYERRTYTLSLQHPNSTQAKFIGKASNGPRFGEGSLLYVLATDYSSYAVYWACTQILSGEGVALQYQVKTGVLSRMTTLPSTTVDDVDSFLPTGVDYLALDHSDCPPQ